MEIIADIHVHSKYSRATSKQLSPQGLYDAAKIKGIDIVGTGDFTHPQYLAELKEQLEPSPDHPGFFVLKGHEGESNFPLFILSTEISCIYSQGGEGHRNHILIVVASFKAVDHLISKLDKIGNLKSDGRPIIGISSKDLAELVFDIDEKNLVIPAHVWTPWFSTFGSKSGFDSLSECFGEASTKILAIETGLSSDPPMNWRVKELDDYAIISNGDAHSSRKLGREATVYELESVTYNNMRQALANSASLDKKKLPGDYIKYTIEFYPEEGKYHWDGHRVCKVQFSPEQSQAENNICPKCRKPLTLGVMNRVKALAQRTEEEALEYAKISRPDYKKIVPLEELVAEAVGQNMGTKKVTNWYQDLINTGHNEFNILLKLSVKELAELTQPEVVEAIKRMRDGDIHISPGYDGVFGEVKAFSQADRAKLVGAQTNMF